MGVLLKKSNLNWIPKSSFHFKFVDDILKLNKSEQWILEEAKVISKLNLYTFDLRTKSRKEVFDFLEVIKSVITLNKDVESTIDNKVYLELLDELYKSVERQIKSID